MVDWAGLLKWSLQYQDGTHASEFKEMSKEDREWLQEALAHYTYNDTDRLTEICKKLKEETSTLKTEELSELIDELQELVELHPRNNINLCLTGGMQEIVAIILGYPDKNVRQQACTLFGAAAQNNKEV
jgi:hypothetical protein